ncbi:MAG TPA: ABC transporter permease [Methanocella sp.]|nr:ABC transporter permease [Methanocella sp.]
MWNVLIIAKREVKRFRTRFSGGSRGIVLLVLVAALIVSYFVAQSGFSLSRGFYTIGVSPSAPHIDDSRFNVIAMSPDEGRAKLDASRIDAYVWNDQVLYRNDRRSQYAVGALKKYLDGTELDRITAEYPIDQGFPLRVQVYNLSANASDAATSVAALIGPTPAPPDPWAGPTPTPAPGAAPVPATSATDDAVLAQLNGSESGFKAQAVANGEVMVPSLYEPAAPLPQVILAFLYIVPMFFISVFFTSSFMDEKTNRKLNILMSTPVSALDIIVGKMLPYLTFSLVVIVAVTLYLGGNLLLAVAVFAPVTLFIFAIYLLVALFYRTYKDQTFFSMTAITFVTGYLVFPALFAGTNNVSLISPLTLAVQMYRGVGFGPLEYAFSTAPLYIVFGLSLYVGVRIFNEEYLMGYGRLHQKTGDAIYLAISQRHPFLSVAALSLLLIPAVFIVELIFLALATNIGYLLLMIVVLLFFCALVEEIAKSAGIAVLIEYGKAGPLRRVLALSFVSALAFWGGEKLLLVVSLGLMPSSSIIDAMNGAAGQAASPLMLVFLLLIPLAAHFVFTSIVCLGTRKLGTKYYLLFLLLGTLLHTLYNVYNLRNMGAF